MAPVDDARRTQPTSRADPWAPAHFRKVARVLAAFAAIDILLCVMLWYGTGQAVRAHVVIPAGELPADVPVVVFYSSVDAERAARLRATSMFVARYGPRPILAVGGSRPGRGYFGSLAMADELVRQGVARDRIVTERHSFDTQTNVEAALSSVGSSRRLVLVSDRLHLARIHAALADQAPDVEAVLVDCGGPDLVWPRLWRLHYEAVAWIFFVLPEPWRRGLIRSVRV
jgi:uncharacterized SAM-binding protein YcdF (DUF218 family)